MTVAFTRPSRRYELYALSDGRERPSSRRNGLEAAA